MRDANDDDANDGVFANETVVTPWREIVYRLCKGKTR
jgi:hypothetical protein